MSKQIWLMIKFYYVKFWNSFFLSFFLPGFVCLFLFYFRFTLTEQCFFKIVREIIFVERWVVPALFVLMDFNQILHTYLNQGLVVWIVYGQTLLTFDIVTAFAYRQNKVSTQYHVINQSIWSIKWYWQYLYSDYNLAFSVYLQQLLSLVTDKKMVCA